MFPPQLPHVFIRWLTEPGDVLYDPFSGRGTVPLEAVLAGRRAYASDANPLAVALSEVKVRIPSASQVRRRITRLEGQFRPPAIDDVPEDIRMLYSEPTLRQLIYCKTELERSRPVDAFLVAMLLGLLARDELDVLVADEAHRIREYSWNWRTPEKFRTETTQIEELIRTAPTVVFFIDDVQVVRPMEVGSSALIRETARVLGVSVEEYELEAQFRCNGSEAFVAWVENTLEIRRTANVLWDSSDESEFLVAETPQELEAWVRARASDGATARLSAGFCWPWSNPRPDGTLVADVSIDGWEMPWNAKPDAARLAPGIPKSNYWATDPGGLDQVGCIYTAKGFEYGYAGVIFGRTSCIDRIEGGSDSRSTRTTAS